ncbi:cysteine--tRNA ligase [Wolbachia pipientis]|uniref:Cysteine--tRNA ligase n=1 Tax=Wolbachia pipientis TaxID=955 RepID=A0A1E7QIR8_WOLPI|nr:cysteine--tRNA ligase [Wolbachia pipientis]OEY86372.1 cysteine--tRNA ligase [Wolbachia pipientis]
MIQIFNTLTKKKELFRPIDESHITIYVCGPTVYDFAHIGNARSVVVYDILFRLLKLCYNKVTYIRNITDIDDKIIQAAENNEKGIKDITDHYTKAFHDDIKSLQCLEPTYEPKATENIKHIIKLIEHLISSGHAYHANNHIYFSIESYCEYGMLSGKKVDELTHGSRVEIDKNKKHPGDFVLWKPADDIDYKLLSYWQSPWGEGRPGWHIECSAMSYSCLGQNFDIHGGGIDLQFPHHENEIAQNKSAFPGSIFARYWVHNGFLTINKEKMSKSLLNIVSIRDLLSSGIKGEVIRYALLKTHYRKPLDWTEDIISESQENLNKFYKVLNGIDVASVDLIGNYNVSIPKDFIDALKNDLNVPEALAVLHEMVAAINKASYMDQKLKLIKAFVKSAQLIGLMQSNYEKWFAVDRNYQEIEKLINMRRAARLNKDYMTADAIREKLKQMGISISDNKNGTITW